MKIETKFNIGDKVLYDGIKLGRIVGYEIQSTKGIFYVIKAEKDPNRADSYYEDLAFLKNRGALRHEDDLIISQ